MAKAPRYQDLRAQEQEAQMANQQMMQKQELSNQLGLEAEANKNPVLNRYMQEQANGLGDINPAQYVNQAVSQAQDKNQETYSAAMLQEVINGKMDPKVLLEDPAVLEEDKMVLMSLMQGGPQDQAPVGLEPM